MSESAAPVREPIPIGEISKPPFARLPDPADVFRRRAERFRTLAENHQLGPYLRFLSEIAAAQDRAGQDLPEPERPSAEELARARDFSMPPLDRNRFARDPALAVALERVLDELAATEMPEEARAALGTVRLADEDTRLRMAKAVLDSAVPFEAVAEHVFVAAGLQVHAARLAAGLDAAALVPLEECLCPACGSAPASSTIVGWHGSHGARFCTCSLCGTMWNYVRVRCTACGTTEGISYRSVEDGNPAVQAETCEGCRSSLKILNAAKDPALEAVADDVASVALDLLVAEAGYRRSGVNPFLIGY